MKFQKVYQRKRPAEKSELHWTYCNNCKTIMALSDGYEKTKMFRQNYRKHMAICGQHVRRYKVLQ
jgi:mannose/cellobiose epimerase-like protein (N-acyl-D-glucosamine 2-epimerase family)